MNIPHLEPSQPLCDQIQAEARQAVAALRAQARQQAAALRASTLQETQARRDRLLSDARQEAARKAELILAAVPVETARLRATRIERLLTAVHDEIRQRIDAREGFDYLTTLIELAVEAATQMPGNAFRLRLSPSDRQQFGEQLAQAIPVRVGRSGLTLTVTGEDAVTGGGVVVTDSDQRVIWDNQLTARLDRLWPGLRCQVAAELGFQAADQNPGPIP